VLATDSLIINGGELAELSGKTLETFNQLLPAAWSHNNPVDILGDGSPERYAKALEIASQDVNSDGILVILTPQAMTDPTQTAEQLKPYAHTTGKPIIASWMGGDDIATGEMILNRSDIPTFPYPDTAARMFDYMASYADNLRSLYETPMLAQKSNDGEPDREKAAQLIQNARRSGRTILTEFESKQLLAAYGIPTVDTRIACSEEEAATIAEEIGYPVVIKLHSETITHKTDVGGVELNLENAESVRKAFRRIEESVGVKAGPQHFLGVTVQKMANLEGYELILGSSLDPQFGPVLLFGLGGSLVEVFKDRALGLPPLNTTLARRMMERTRIYTALKGVRGRKPVDLIAVEQLLVRFSQLIAEQRWIKELDINPLIASPESLLALDARVLLFEHDIQEDNLPKLAIRPYPAQYVSSMKANNGQAITIRPIRPEDEPKAVKFHETLSDRTVYMRYLHPMLLSQRVAHERLARICHCDYDREITLIAETQEPQTGETIILGAGRLSKMHGLNNARFSLLITDSAQGLGIGKEMLKQIIKIGRDEKLQRIESTMTRDNQVMQRLCIQLGFRLSPSTRDGMVTAELVLD